MLIGLLKRHRSLKISGLDTMLAAQPSLDLPVVELEREVMGVKPQIQMGRANGGSRGIVSNFRIEKIR